MTVNFSRGNGKAYGIPSVMLAKSNPAMSVFAHCRLVGCVAKVLFEKYPKTTQKIIGNSVALLAACHDIGKISPYFQSILQHCDVPTKNIEYSRNNVTFHAYVSKFTFKNDEFARFVLGWHHGFAPVEGKDIDQKEDNEVFGGPVWSSMRHDLFDRLKKDFSCNDSDLPKSWDQSFAISGFVIVSDWIASDPSFYLPFENIIEKADIGTIERKVRQKLDNMGFISPRIKKNLSFYEVFGFEPRKVQRDFFENVRKPGVYVLEAPMGLGKTEAALYAAYRSIESDISSGIYFALPSQLTSNKIHERFQKFLDKISDNQDIHSRLIHGSAWLEKTFGETAPGKSWFDGSRKGIIYPLRLERSIRSFSPS